MEKITTLISLKNLLINECVCKCGAKITDINEVINMLVTKKCDNCRKGKNEKTKKD